MRRLATTLLLLPTPLMSLGADPAPALTPAQDEAALLLAWEKAQLADSRTKLLQHTGPRAYQFKTERFPYEGALEVKNIVIQTSPAAADYVSGTIEVKLDQPNSVLHEQYPVSFPAWSADNYMMKDTTTGNWVTLTEWGRLRRERRDSRLELPWWSGRNLGALGILVAVGLLLIAAVAAAARYQRATARRLHEDAVLRAKLIANAESAAARDKLLLGAMEKQRDLLEAALSGTRSSRRWFPRRSSSSQASEPTLDFTPDKMQLQRLDLYQALRDVDDPRPILSSRKAPRRQWIAITAVLLCLLALALLGATKVFLFISGIVLGMALMTLANREIFAQLWPALRRALDWNKIDAFLKNQRSGK